MKIKLRKKYLNLCEDFSKVSETFISINQIDDAYQGDLSDEEGNGYSKFNKKLISTQRLDKYNPKKDFQYINQNGPVQIIYLLEISKLLISKKRTYLKIFIDILNIEKKYSIDFSSFCFFTNSIEDKKIYYWNKLTQKINIFKILQTFLADLKSFKKHTDIINTIKELIVLKKPFNFNSSSEDATKIFIFTSGTDFCEDYDTLSKNIKNNLYFLVLGNSDLENKMPIKKNVPEEKIIFINIDEKEQQ